MNYKWWHWYIRGIATGISVSAAVISVIALLFD